MADNITIKDKDNADKIIRYLELTGAIFLPTFNLRDTADADALGLVTASPAANTLLGRLKALQDKDFATQTTLATLLTEATFSGIDFATQTTLAALLTELEAHAQGTSADPVVSQLSGRTVAPTIVDVTTTPLAADGSFTSAWINIDDEPGFQAVALQVFADTLTVITVEASDGTSTEGNSIVDFAVAPSVFNPVPYFRPTSKRYRYKISNRNDSTAQTVLRVSEVRSSFGLTHPQNLRAVLAYNTEIRDTTKHTPSNNKSIYRVGRRWLGSGKVPIFVNNQLDQQVSLEVVLALAGVFNTTLGVVDVPAGSQYVITNADFVGIDVPSEQITVTPQCATAPTTGNLNIYVAVEVGGTS